MDSAEPADSLREALELLRRALTLLDSGQAPAVIGAYVDIAREKLRDYIEAEWPDS